MRLSYSQIKMWKRCRRKWYYSYQENLKPKARVPRMDLGSCVHALLENHYLNTGISVEEASENFFNEKVSDSTDEELMAHFRAVQVDAENIFKRYVNTYAEIDKKWEILGVEKEFLVEIPGTGVNMKMIIDLIVKDEDGRIWLVDHKVTSVNFEDWGELLVLDEQANVYLWGLNQLGIKASGVIFNLLRSKLPTVPKALKNGGLSQAKNIDTDYTTYLQAIKETGLNPNDYGDILSHIAVAGRPFFGRHHTGRSPEEITVIGQELKTIATEFATLSQDENLMPVRTANGNCRWDCQFKELCIMESKLLDTQLYKDTEFDRK